MITISTSLRQHILSRRAKLVVCFFSLGAALSYRWATLLPEVLEAYFLFGLSTLFLACAIFTRRSFGLRNYWEIPYAFSIFAFAGSLDIFLTQSFLANILHQSPTFTNPFASTVQGTVAAQLVSTVSIVIPIAILTKLSGRNLDSIFIDRHLVRKGLPIGVFGFLVFYSLTMTGLLQLFFPSNISLTRFLSLTPVILALTLSNGLREELWFRGLFLKKYEKFLSPSISNLLQASIFASFHLQAHYTPFLLVFVGITFMLGLWLGHLMRASGNILGPAVFHAGADIPIFLVFLSQI